MKCINPYYVEQEVPVPCGRCTPCLKTKISQWSFRLQQQEKSSITSYFVTLTYNSENVPISRMGYLTLRYKDVQDWLKKIRKENGIQIKYYCVGEYGGKKGRPHYHLIMFNVENLNMLVEKWDKGDPYFGTVTPASVGYCLKYILKPPKYRYYKNDDREPSKARMSKGLGLDYITKNILQWHKNDLLERLCCIAPGGSKVSIPRYYRNRIYTDLEKKEIQEHIENTYHLRDHEFQKKLIEWHGDGWRKVLYDIITYQDSNLIFNSDKNTFL